MVPEQVVGLALELARRVAPPSGDVGAVETAAVMVVEMVETREMTHAVGMVAETMS